MEIWRVALHGLVGLAGVVLVLLFGDTLFLHNDIIENNEPM